MKWLLSVIYVICGYLFAALFARIFKTIFINELIIVLTTWLFLMTKNWLDALDCIHSKGEFK